MKRLWLCGVLVLLGGPFASSAWAQTTVDSVIVRLDPLEGSGISGTAVLHARRGETDFALTLTAADRNQRRREFEVWLRAGTCQAPDRKVADIDDVRADGRTEHEDEDVALADLVRGNHVLEVRVEDRDDVVACGAIPSKAP